MALNIDKQTIFQYNKKYAEREREKERGGEGKIDRMGEVYWNTNLI